MLSVSERKTTEIKLRVTPAEKTAWQIAAERRGVGLSKLVRDCVQESLWAEQNQRRDGLAVTHDAVWIQQHPLTAEEAFFSDAQGEDSPIAPVSTSGGETTFRRPWMFEARDSD